MTSHRSSTATRRLEIAWTLVPLATFLSLFGLTAANMPFINNVHAGTQYTVTVIGVQFSWTFDYGATSSGARIRSFGTLYLPEGTDVALNIVSTDPPCNSKPSIPSRRHPGAGDRERGMRSQPQLLCAVARSADERHPR